MESILNVPNAAVRVLNLKAGDVMRWTLVDGMLQIRCIKVDD